MFGLTKKYDEKTLIDDCKKGKRAAQELLYKKWSGKMLGVCFRYLNDRDEAEDAMIVGFAKVFAALETYRGEGSFEGWLRRIIVNEALTTLRRKKRVYFEEIEAADYATSIELPQNQQHLEEDDLLYMVQRLPTGYKMVFNLYAIEGYSHKEIAETLNIQEGTSKSQLNRARSMLKEMIADTENFTEKKTLMSHE